MNQRPWQRARGIKQITRGLGTLDRELFDAIAERYGATAKHYKGTPTLDPFDSFQLTIEGRQVNVFLSDTARNSVNTVIEQVAA